MTAPEDSNLDSNSWTNTTKTS